MQCNRDCEENSAWRAVLGFECDESSVGRFHCGGDVQCLVGVGGIASRQTGREQWGTHTEGGVVMNESPFSLVE